MSRFTSPTALADRLARLERRDVEPLDLRPVARPADCGSWFDDLSAELTAAALRFRTERDVAEVAENLASLKADGGSPFLIELNTKLLAALRSSDPRPYLAGQWHAANSCGVAKVRLVHWMQAHAAIAARPALMAAE